MVSYEGVFEEVLLIFSVKRGSIFGFSLKRGVRERCLRRSLGLGIVDQQRKVAVLALSPGLCLGSICLLFFLSSLSFLFVNSLGI